MKRHETGVKVDERLLDGTSTFNVKAMHPTRNPRCHCRASTRRIRSLARNVSLSLNRGRSCFQILQPLLAATLGLQSLASFRTAGAEAGSWIMRSSCLMYLEFGQWFGIGEPVVSLVPLHGFSPIPQSLRMDGLPSPLHKFSVSSFHSLSSTT